MNFRVNKGDRVPQVTLARLQNGRVQHVDLHELVAGKRVLIAGMPGAFTPVCTCEHVPNLIGNATRLRAKGLELVICVMPNNPWIVEAWAREVDPDNKLLFLADAGLSLARALGCTVYDEHLGLGETSARFLLLVERGIVHQLSAERQLTDLTCTRADEVEFID